jgi:hypothetical protein
MPWLLITLVSILGGALLLRWFVRADPRAVLRAFRWIGIVLAVVFLLAMVVTGRFHFLFAALAFLIPWLARFRRMRTAFKSARGPQQGQMSEVRTRFVIMQLNHDTGEMDGMVQEGTHAGRQLSDLSLEAAIAVYREALAADEQSAQVLQAYLDRMHDASWRDRMGGAAGGASDPGNAPGSAGPMSYGEALDILGLSSNPSEQDIKFAHRQLMQKFHPDRGGSDYLAARINEAKEVLLGDR